MTTTAAPDGTDLGADAETAYDAVLADAEVVHLRPLEPTDASALRELYQRMSPRSVYLRYFSGAVDISRAVNDLLRVADGHEVVVAVLDGRVVGVAGYERLADPSRAEVAFMVEDAHQHLGIATVLMRFLVARARAHGITVLLAQTLLANVPMLRLFSHCGLAETVVMEGGVAEVTLTIDPG
jgi:GNAT superfamily N-acetyltransferase